MNPCAHAPTVTLDEARWDPVRMVFLHRCRMCGGEYVWRTEEQVRLFRSYHGLE